MDKPEGKKECFPTPKGGPEKKVQFPVSERKPEPKKLTKEKLQGFKEAVMDSLVLAEKEVGNPEEVEFAKRIIKGFNMLFSHITVVDGEVEKQKKTIANQLIRIQGEEELTDRVKVDREKLRDLLKEKNLALFNAIQDRNKFWAERDTLKQKVEELDTAYKQLAGKKFSDRSYHAIKSRAERAEALIEKMKKGISNLCHDSGCEIDRNGWCTCGLDELKELYKPEALKQACTEGEKESTLFKDAHKELLEGQDKNPLNGGIVPDGTGEVEG